MSAPHRRLFDELTRFENLHQAAMQVLRGKRTREAAGDVFTNLERVLFRLQRELRERSYLPGAYKSFWINDPKRRLISAAPLRDRIVHHSLVQVLEPLFERRFIYHSYANRRGKGTQRARAQFVEWARSHRYVLKMDLRKFFPSIDHAVLKRELRRGIGDPGLLWLCDLIIDHANPQEAIVQYFPGDDLLTPIERRVGLPIGNLTSQFFANVLLDHLDHALTDKRRAGAYLRYVDDFCVFGDAKAELTARRAEVCTILGELRLRLNEGKSRLRQVTEGVTFLGFVVTRDQLRLAQTAVRRQRRRVVRLRTEYASGQRSLAQVAASYRAWHAHAMQGTTWRLRTAMARRGWC